MDNNDTQVRLASKRQGYSPIPCRGKRPFLSQWQTRHNVSEDEIRQWPLGNTGHLTENTPVLDCDIKDPAAAGAMAELVRDWFDSKGTILVRTGNPPKFAIPFRTATPFAKMVETLTAPNGADYRIEVLCQGQQYIVDGIHPDTDEPYLWQGNVAPWHIHRDELPEVSPISMRELLDHMVETLIEDFGYKRTVSNGACGTHQTSAAEPKGPIDVDAHLSDMRPGNFNDTQWKCVGALLRSGLSFDNTIAEVLRRTKETCADPAWDWEEEEHQITSMAFRTIANNAPELTHLIPDKFRTAFRDKYDRGEQPYFLHRRDTGWQVKAKRNTKQATEAPAAEAKAGTALPFGWVAYDADNITPPGWAIKGLIPDSGVIILPGQWGLHKTGMVLHLSLCLMTGRPFADQYKVKKQGGSMLYALEGFKSIDMRLRAIANFHGDDNAQLPLFKSPTCPPLVRPEAAQQMIDHFRQTEAYCREVHGLPISIIWVDTYSMAAGHTESGADNDRAATQRAYTTLRRVALETGVTVGVVDHYGKMVEAGTTGSSGKEGNADAVLANLGDRDSNGSLSRMRMVVRKQREGRAGIEIPFEPEVVDMGLDEDGDPVTAVALRFGKARDAQVERKLSPSDLLLDRAFDDAIRDSSFPLQLETAESVPAVYEELVRDIFYEMLPRGDGTDKQERTKRAMTFSRAMTKALLGRRFARRDSPDGVILYRDMEGAM
jgi:hypothetical protein